MNTQRHPWERPELTTDAEELRRTFEAQARDPSYGFRRSHKGNYVNPQLSRDWKWFQRGYAAALGSPK